MEYTEYIDPCCVLSSMLGDRALKDRWVTCVPCRHADTGIVMIATINQCSFGALEMCLWMRAPNSVFSKTKR